MIRTAVILAAGLGSRLKERTAQMPKGFLELDGKAIVRESIRKLIEAGVDRIIIGTGYLKEYYEALTKECVLIECKENPKYADTGSMATLHNLRDLIKEDFLLLESDLVYDSVGLKVLQNQAEKDVILASGRTDSGDEVYIETMDNGQLKTLSKKKEELSRINGELVGISKISLETYRNMCSYAEKVFPDKPKQDYEHVMIAVSDQARAAGKKGFTVKIINDYTWCEIDDESHLKRALSQVYPKILERESLLKIRRDVLLNPGPATTTDSVKYAQVMPDICHREKEFGDLLHFVTTELTGFAGDTEDYTTVLLGGSGTAAVESMLSSVIGDGRLLIVNNGAYGERMCQIADVYDLDYINFQSSLIEPVDFTALEKAIQDETRKRKVTHLAIVHNETTTGLLNDIQRAGLLCEKLGMEMIVDAISSYAALPISMKDMRIHYLAASSNKNIQGMAGVGFVIADKKALEKTASYKVKSFYLNLFKQYDSFKKGYQLRFTPPVQTLYALRQAIIEAKAEGINNRCRRYSESWETLIRGVEKLKLKLLVKKEHQSKIITAIYDPECPGYNFDRMHDYFYERGFTIYPGKVSKYNTFRVANIGAINKKDMENFLELLESYLLSAGYQY